MSSNSVGSVMSCSPEAITVVVDTLSVFEENKGSLQIGRFLKICQGNRDFTIASIRNIKGTAPNADGINTWQFLIECQAIGTLTEDGKFERGSLLLPVPTERAFVADQEALDQIFASDADHNFRLGRLSMNREIELKLHGDRLFSKHIAVVGSTGSGKSCAVAKILHEVVGISNNLNGNKLAQKNGHIVIFDLHDEYTAAFSLGEGELFTLNKLGVDTLRLPYWMMNSEELESMFIESNEANSHNQVSQFKNAVVLNKERHNPSLTDVTYDTPVYFSIREVHHYIENMNREIIGKMPGEDVPKLANGTLVQDRTQYYFSGVLTFVVASQAAIGKASNGPFHGEFNRFSSRLEAKLSDRRLRFLLAAKKVDGTDYMTADFEVLMRQFLGYIDKSNVTIVDLGGIPFEALSVVVSLVSRLIFDFCFHYSKLRHAQGVQNDIPVMIVCEEAHNYVPRDTSVAYRASRRSIERIAKEGRKYGLSLMVVSQRPSEISETIFAQCNNFLALRLSNDADQNYVKRLVPDNANSITDLLPNLAPGECIVIGDAVPLPAVVRMDMPVPEPHSRSVKVHSEWHSLWRDVVFSDVIAKWRR